MRQRRKKHHSWEQKLHEKGLQPALLMWRTIAFKEATNEVAVLIVGFLDVQLLLEYVWKRMKSSSCGWTAKPGSRGKGGGSPL